LVKVAFVSIEGGDTLNRLRGEMNHVPHIVGYQCSGVVSRWVATSRNSRRRPGGFYRH